MKADQLTAWLDEATSVKRFHEEVLEGIGKGEMQFLDRAGEPKPKKTELAKYEQMVLEDQELIEQITLLLAEEEGA